MSKVRIPDPEGFADFWQIWQPVCRESDGKPKARAAFTQHVLAGADPQDIIDAARWHIRQRQENKTLGYIQLAASWLNAERYEFEAGKERAHQAWIEERKQGANVVSIKAAPLPANHFSRRWAEQQKQEG